MRALDLSTLVVILGAGFELGAKGLFGVSLFGWLFGSWRMIAYDVAGLAAVWQLFRQRM